MRIEKREENNNELSIKQDVVDTFNDYQSLNISFEDAVKRTAHLFNLSEEQVKEVLPEKKKEQDDSDEEEPTMETIMKKLSKKEQELLKKEMGNGEKKKEPGDSEEEKKEKKKENILTIEEDFEVPGTDIVLEKGDRIRIVSKPEEKDN